MEESTRVRRVYSQLFTFLIPPLRVDTYVATAAASERPRHLLVREWESHRNDECNRSRPGREEGVSKRVEERKKI